MLRVGWVALWGQGVALAVDVTFLLCVGGEMKRGWGGEFALSATYTLKEDTSRIKRKYCLF